MSQRAVEGVLGRLVTDAEFRSQFFNEPDAVCRDDGADLTSAELSALVRVDPHALHSLAARLDPKIVRAVTVGRSFGRTTVSARTQRANRPQRRAL